MQAVEIMENESHNPSRALLLRSFEVETPPEDLSEEQVLEALSERIAYMLEHQMEYLLSLLYRNDVEEHHIQRVLSPAWPEPAPLALAKLVLERQKNRLQTKKQIRVDPIPDLDDELKL